MQSFKNVEEFYSENSAGLRSPAADYGVHWKLEGWPNSFRVSYVRDTGEIYAVQQGPIPSGILPTGEIIIATRPEATGPEEGPVASATSPSTRKPGPAMSTTKVWTLFIQMAFSQNAHIFMGDKGNQT